MENLTRRLFLRKVASAGAVASSAVAPVIAEVRNHPVDDDGPLLADDVTGTTAYADWHERKYGYRPE